MQTSFSARERGAPVRQKREVGSDAGPGGWGQDDIHTTF